MIINFSKDRRLISDIPNSGFYLQELKDGEWWNYGFFGSFQNASKSIPQQLLTESDCRDLKQVISLLKDVQKEIRDSLDKEPVEIPDLLKKQAE